MLNTARFTLPVNWQKAGGITSPPEYISKIDIHLLIGDLYQIADNIKYFDYRCELCEGLREKFMDLEPTDIVRGYFVNQISSYEASRKILVDELYQELKITPEQIKDKIRELQAKLN